MKIKSHSSKSSFQLFQNHHGKLWGTSKSMFEINMPLINNSTQWCSISTAFEFLEMQTFIWGFKTVISVLIYFQSPKNHDYIISTLLLNHTHTKTHQSMQNLRLFSWYIVFAESFLHFELKLSPMLGNLSYLSKVLLLYSEYSNCSTRLRYFPVW